MLSDSVRSYLSLRRGLGYRLKEVGLHLTGFATYSDQRGYQHIRTEAVIEWATLRP